MTTDRLRILAAAAALGEFTVPELAAHTGILPGTVSQVLRRERAGRGLFEQTSLSRPSKGRPAVLWRVRQAAAILEELAHEESEVAGLQAETGAHAGSEAAHEPAGQHHRWLGSAEEALAQIWETDDRADQKMLAGVAVNFLRAADPRAEVTGALTDQPDWWEQPPGPGPDLGRPYQRARRIAAIAALASADAGESPAADAVRRRAAEAVEEMAREAPSEQVAVWIRWIVLACLRAQGHIPPVMVLTPAGTSPVELFPGVRANWRPHHPPPWVSRHHYRLWAEEWAGPLLSADLVPCIVLQHDHRAEADDVLAEVLARAGRSGARQAVVVASTSADLRVAAQVARSGCVFYPLHETSAGLSVAVKRSAELAVGAATAAGASSWPHDPAGAGTGNEPAHKAAGQVSEPPAPPLTDRGQDARVRAHARCIATPVTNILDLSLIGVRPARPDRKRGESRDPGLTPRYVLRSVDHELRGLLTRSSFILLMGDSAAGKTRTAYEAVAAVLPGHTLVAPLTAGAEAMGEAMRTARALPRCVLWLDDFYKLGGRGELTASDVSDLIDDEECHRVIMATLTVSEYAKFADKSEASVGQISQKVLRRAHRILLPRMLDDAELKRAEGTNDSRISDALKHPQYGLAEYLAAGPELFDRWQKERLRGGGHARGAALISAAVDCRRAGMYASLSVDLVERIHENYLSPSGARKDSESLGSAWAWATMHGSVTGALAVRRDGETKLVEVFDYLTDEYERLATPMDQVPTSTLLASLRYATASEAMRIGQIAQRYGQYSIALQAFTNAAEKRTRRLGPQDRSTLISRNSVARAIRLLGRFDDAEAEHRDVLAIQRSVLGEYDLDTITSLDNHARALRLLGRYDSAEAEHRTALDIRWSALGPSDPATLTSRNGLARVLLALGRAEEAEREHRAVLAARIRILAEDDWYGLAEDHPDVLTSRNDLGRTLLALGRLKEAEAECRAALEARIRVLGRDHPQTLSSRVDLGRVLLALGRLDEAQEDFRAALLARTRILGKDHPDTADSRDRLEAIEDRIRTAQADAVLSVGGRGLLEHGGYTPLLSQITDPREVGVQAARTDQPLSRVGSSVPGYIRRDVDDHLRGLLKESGFVLLVGESATGKTRTAFEAAATVLPDYPLIAPQDRISVGEAVTLAAELPKCVLWLDDLYRLMGREGLTRDHVTRLINDRKHHRIILATIREADLAHLTDASAIAVMQMNRDALQQAHYVRLHREWTTPEMRELAAVAPELADIIGRTQAKSLPLYLTGGAEQFGRWRAECSRTARHRRGAALVSAAVDLSRAGLFHAPSRALINDIHRYYLDGRDPDDDLDSAWDWATTPGPATAALTIRKQHKAPSVDEDHAEVLSYLVDEYERVATAEDQPPDETFVAALDEANTTEAMRIGLVAMGNGRYPVALAAFTKAAEGRVRRFKSDHPATLASRSQRARLLRLTGRLAEAEEEQRAVLRDQDRVLGPNDPATLTSRDNLARILRVTGRYPEAEAEHRAVLAARTRILGADHPDTLASRNHLARVLHALGQYEIAETEFRVVLAARSKAPQLGVDHPRTLATRHDLASVLRDSGNLAEAKIQYRVVLQARTKVLGSNHPDTMATRAALEALIAAEGGGLDELNRTGSEGQGLS